MRFALRVLQITTIAIVVSASTHTTFDLDRFLVPKELVLHLAAAVAGVAAWRRITIGRRDLLLVLFLALSAVSAVGATNPWLAFRALAISASGVLLFLVARALRDAGLARPLLGVLACGVVLAAATSLLQAYGLWLDLFTGNRAPGGTLGNRNFVAHAAAFGYPVVLLAALWARRRAGTAVACLGIAIVTAALVLTRSRAAWLAFAAMLLVFVTTLVFRRDGAGLKRFVGVLLFAAGGVAAALLVPNTLRWNSDNPYIESVKSVANYQEGSGRGRLIQYERSLVMAARRPLLGVGPGNWAVDYPEHAARRDPSLDPAETGMTYNPWPSSDWVAFAAERGFAAAIVLALFFLALLRRALTVTVAAAEGDGPPSSLVAATLLGTIVAACVAGAFDAVLLLPLPAFFVWTTIGALMPAEPAPHAGPLRALTVVLLVALAAIGVSRSATQLAAMEMLTRGSAARAAQLDPGNYRAHLRLARGGPRKQRCTHAHAAHALFPNAGAARELVRACD
jgi:O-antigen ligase